MYILQYVYFQANTMFLMFLGIAINSSKTNPPNSALRIQTGHCPSGNLNKTVLYLSHKLQSIETFVGIYTQLQPIFMSCFAVGLA